MPRRPCVVLGLLTAGVLVGTAGSAQADLVKFTSGRVLSVESARFEGDIVVLLMRGGGEVRAPRNLVQELLPDEVPLNQRLAAEARDVSAFAAGPRPGRAALEALVDQIAARVGLDRRLAHAVVRAESNYDPLAISPMGAMGLMQLMPVVVREYAVTDPFDPEQNLEAGMRHLRRLLGRMSVTRALAAYNAGEGAVARYGGIPPYRETENYVRRIMSMLQ